MAKTAVGKVAEVAAEQQTHSLIQKAVGQLEDFATGIAQAASMGKRRKYVLAALAALVIAGKAADTIRASMAASSQRSARKAAGAKAAGTPTRAKKAKAKTAKRRSG